MTARIWLSWEKQRRNKSLSKKLSAKLFELESNNHPLIRYPILLVKTLAVLKRERAKFVFAQNPSICLALFVATFGKIMRKRVIIDAHNVGICFDHPFRLVKFVGQILNIIAIKLASITIVTNANLASYVMKVGGRPFVLPDPIPSFEDPPRIKLGNKQNVFYICSFSQDEPYLEMLEAAKYLNENIFIFVSGNFNKKVLSENIPDNVILTGYLPELEYLGYLHSSDLIIDLTCCEDCLVCGAYEAIAAEKPLILSNTSALKGYFSDSALYTENNALDIAKTINYALDNISLLTMRSKEAKIIKNKEWEQQKNILEGLLERI